MIVWQQPTGDWIDSREPNLVWISPQYNDMYLYTHFAFVIITWVIGGGLTLGTVALDSGAGGLSGRDECITYQE
jgi:hypothetical protein